MKLNEILNIVIVASASLTALCILLQARGASLGAAVSCLLPGEG